jgi:hypothetical protein
MSDRETYPCACGANVVVTFATKCARSAAPVPLSVESEFDDLVVEVDPMREFSVANQLQMRHGFAHVGSGMIDGCREHVLSLRDRIIEADTETLRRLDQLDLDATTYPCPCGAMIRVTATATCGPSPDEVLSEYTARIELRITRDFAHEPSDLMDGCRQHLLSLRGQLATTDLERLGEDAQALEDRESQTL